MWLHSKRGIHSVSKKEPPPASWVWSDYKIYAIQPWRLFPVTPRLWTIHRDGEVLTRLSKHGPGHESPMTIPEFFRESVNRFGSYPALASKKNGKWEVLNYNQYYEACRKTARAMLKVSALFTHSFIRPSCIKSFLLCGNTYGTKCTRHPEKEGSLVKIFFQIFVPSLWSDWVGCIWFKISHETVVMVLARLQSS